MGPSNDDHARRLHGQLVSARRERRVGGADVHRNAGGAMTPVVDVPLNTAIADLDEGLRDLLRSDLRRHGFDGVEISFDAPTREWAGRLTGPAVNLFLYDIREARDRAT